MKRRRSPARPARPLRHRSGSNGSDQDEEGELDAHAGPATFNEQLSWEPEFPKIRPARLIAAWLVAALSLLAAAAIIPGASIEGFWERSWSPWSWQSQRRPAAADRRPAASVHAGRRLPAGARRRRGDPAGRGFAHRRGDPARLVLDRALVALVADAVSIVLQVMVGATDDDTYTLRVIHRLAKRSGERVATDQPGSSSWIDGLALPSSAGRCATATHPTWRAGSPRARTTSPVRPDLSSQTGASQAGILLGSNEDISAFRWVEKETGTLMTCSAPPDCAEIERRHSTGIGLLANGGASRGNLLSGEADLILTVSKLEAEKSANPGYRAFLANGFNVARARPLLLGGDPRDHRLGATAPARRAAARTPRRPLSVHARRDVRVVRDLIVYGVLTDMMKDAPPSTRPSPATTRWRTTRASSAQDTLEALTEARRPVRAHRPRALLRAAAVRDRRPLRPRPDAGRTFKQRNGYGLDDLVERSLATGEVAEMAGGDEQNDMVGHALGEATGRTKKQKRPKNDVSGESVVVLGSGNLGLVYLMEENRRLTLEELEERHPALIPALCGHQHRLDPRPLLQ